MRAFLRLVFTGLIITTYPIFALAAEEVALNERVYNTRGSVITETITGSFEDLSIESVNGSVQGAAIYNEGTIGDINSDFIRNSVYSENSTALGSAIVNDYGASISTITGQFIENVSITNQVRSEDANTYNAIGSILNLGSITTIQDSSFEGNIITATGQNSIIGGGAIFNHSTITSIINGNFFNNSIVADGLAAFAGGGAINNNLDEGFITNIIDSTFSDNTVTAIGEESNAKGGAIHSSGTIGEIYNVVFENNSVSSEGVDSYAMAGALAVSGSIGSIVDADFIGNTVKSDLGTGFGGAIVVLNSGSIDTISANFVDNKVIAGKAHGGAIKMNGVINSISGTFINNSAESITGAAQGGAINMNSEDDVIGILNADFNNNSVYGPGNSLGGAILISGTVSEIYGGYDSNSSISTASKARGGALANVDGYIGLIEADFSNNYVKGAKEYSRGGAIINTTQIDTIKGVFSTNIAEAVGIEASGAAIANIGGKIDFIESYFEQNSAISTSGSAIGGAIYNTGTLGYIEGSFAENTATSTSGIAQGGAITNIGGTIGDIRADFSENSAVSYSSSQGGAIYNVDGSIGNINGNFSENSIKANMGCVYGGAIYNYTNSGNVRIESITGNFIGNSIESVHGELYGGAIYNAANTGTAEIGFINANFIGNTIKAEQVGTSYGGAIFNEGDIGYIHGDFSKNSIDAYGSAQGGAINNYGTIGEVVGDFIENSVHSESRYAYGSAIHNGGTIDRISGNFIGNSVLSDKPVVDPNLTAGGTIHNRTTIGVIENSTFKDNTVTSYGDAFKAYGGGIYNSGIIDEIKNVTFENNSVIANGTGGYAFGSAIDNSGTINAINNVIFDGNTTISYGNGRGAIDNSGIIGTITGAFINNSAETKENTSNSSQGGAIFNNVGGSEIGTIKADFVNNSITNISYSLGGAIANGGTIGSIQGNFDSNKAVSTGGNVRGGAIGNAKGSINEIKANFTNNIAQGANDYSRGGAIWNNATINTLEAYFEGNKVISETAAQGGAIYNSGTLGSIDGSFIGNSASSTFGIARGGAIYNSVTINTLKAYFENNSAISKGDNVQGGAIYNEGTIGENSTIIASFINNTAASEYFTVYGGAISNKGTMGNIEGVFKANSASAKKNVSAGGAIYNQGTMGYIMGNFEDNKAVSLSGVAYAGAIYNGGTIEQIVDSSFVNNSVASESGFAYGGAIYNGGTIDKIVNSNFVNNSAVSETGSAQGGAIYNSYADLNLTSDNYNMVISGNYTKSNGVVDDNAIYLNNANDTLTLNLKNSGTLLLQDNINGSTGYNVDIIGDDIGKTALYLQNDIYNADVTFATTTINTINNSVHNYNFNSLTLNGDINFVADVDLKNQQMDRFSANSYGTHNGTLNVIGMNLLSDAVNDSTSIYFAENGLKNNVINSVNMLPDSTYQSVVYSPIYKYNVSYNVREDGGYFDFNRMGTSAGNASTAFNPAVLSAAVTAQVGAYANQNSTYKYAFQHSHDYMHLPYHERLAIKNNDKFAIMSSPTRLSDLDDLGDRSIWVRPYTNFETVPLKNGPEVNIISYGTIIGADTGIHDLRHGWSTVNTTYMGYNGSSQSYSGVDTTQNGGVIGSTQTFYKGNFFSAITASVGASVGENNNMYGNEHFTMLTAGISSRTGYNFEYKEGLLILQPMMELAYSYVNTFDYTNAAGVKIDADPLHAIQIHPSVKLISNLENGWQPYTSVGMVWNILQGATVSANDVKLPQMSVKPYVEYGVGVQKRWKDKYTGFLQTMFRNGGRNGVALSAGFRWAFHNNFNLEETVENQTVNKERKVLKQSKQKRKISTSDYRRQAN